MQVNNKNQVSFQGKIILGKKAGRLNSNIRQLIEESAPDNVDTFVQKGKKGIRSLIPLKKGEEKIGRKVNLKPGQSNSSDNLKVVFRYLKQFKKTKAN